MPSLEIIRPDYPRGPFAAAVFDFDGTLSLLRRNWQDVMIPMMADILQATGTSETREELLAGVEEFVMRLNGKQTIYQMIQLAEEVEKRGGRALDPLEYKHAYHELLWKQVSKRIDAVRSGRTPRDEMMVPGAIALLDALQSRGVGLYLASGTDVGYVRDEAELLGLAPLFGPNIHGALDDYKKFSKRMVIERLLGELDGELDGGARVIGFGDGFVEIEEIRRVGGLAVGVASNEDTRKGVNDWKRKRLIDAGADIIIGDYRELEILLETVGA